MTKEKVIEILNEDHRFDEFVGIQPKLASRHDLHAFMILDQLVPTQNGDIVTCAEHDEIWLAVSIDELVAANPTEDQIRQLRICGVNLEKRTECLQMYV